MSKREMTEDAWEDPGHPFSEEERLRYAVRPLLLWFRENARELPWRSEPAPYRVWVSEIMLQQTRIEAVKPYFARFMEAYPTIQDLAASEDDRLMKLWEGLGYYSRARNLKKAAVVAVEQYGGELPGDYHALKKLPGIGPYTAGAIASIAFQLPYPAVDGNVLRVLSRLLADFSDIGEAGAKAAAEKRLAKVIPQAGGRPGDLNQAFMELGELICLPNGTPHCEECPWKGLCLAKRQDVISSLPVKMPKKGRKSEEKTVLLIQYGDGPERLTGVRRRGEKGLLAGLYEFPSMEGKMTEKEIRRLIIQCFGTAEGWKVEILPEAKHIFTHIEWRMSGFRLWAPAGSNPGTAGENAALRDLMGELFFAGPDELKTVYPIPTAYKAYLQLV